MPTPSASAPISRRIRDSVRVHCAIVVGALLPCAAMTQDLVAQLPPRPAPRVRLVVQLTVDQMRGDYLDRFGAQLTGGLGWLVRHGAYFTNATHDHGTTETAPGHATLWSGRYPSHTGIVRNNAGVGDRQAPPVTGTTDGASPFRFRGSSLFDWIRSRTPASRALSVSRKDRAAILPLGRAHQQAYWYGYDGTFTTSRYYADTLPSWVQAFNAREVTRPYLDSVWTPLLGEQDYPEPDSVSAENGGRDFVFPHRLPADAKRANELFTEFPWMDDITFALAIEGVNALKLGASDTMDLLSVSLSSTDAVGHRYGPDSKELHDQILRLDRAMGHFLDSLFVLRDSSTIVFALSADHGMSPYPELHFPGTDAKRGRIDAGPVMAATRNALVSRGVARDAIDFESGLVLVDKSALAMGGVNADSVVRDMRAAFSKLAGVQKVYRREELPALAAKGDVIARRWLHSIPDDLDVVLAVTGKPYYYFSGVTYATHGSPHQQDAWVPIVLAGGPFVAGRIARPVFTVDVAPTLAAAIGVSPIEPIDGHVLPEAFGKKPPAATKAGNAPTRRR